MTVEFDKDGCVKGNVDYSKVPQVPVAVNICCGAGGNTGGNENYNQLNDKQKQLADKLTAIEAKLLELKEAGTGTENGTGATAEQLTELNNKIEQLKTETEKAREIGGEHSQLENDFYTYLTENLQTLADEIEKQINDLKEKYNQLKNERTFFIFDYNRDDLRYGVTKEKEHTRSFLLSHYTLPQDQFEISKEVFVFSNGTTVEVNNGNALRIPKYYFGSYLEESIFVNKDFPPQWESVSAAYNMGRWEPSFKSVNDNNFTEEAEEIKDLVDDLVTFLERVFKENALPDEKPVIDLSYPTVRKGVKNYDFTKPKSYEGAMYKFLYYMGKIQDEHVEALGFPLREGD